MKFILAIALLYSSTANADCNYAKYAEDYFSNSYFKDRLYSIITGKNCSSANQILRIKNSSGKIIYEFEEKMGCSDVYGNVTEKDVLKCLGWPLREPIFSDSSSLPAWEVVKTNPMGSLMTFKVKKEAYEYYRSKNWKAFSHNVGYESEQTLVFDRDKEEVVIVSYTSP